MRKSIYDVLTGLVVNVVLLAEDSEYTPPEGFEIGPEAEIGDTVIDGVVVPQTPEEPQAPPVRLADALREFLFAQLEANIEIIDPLTELRIRQLQKSLEPIPGSMTELRFAQGVRPMIEAFELPDVTELNQIKQALLDQIDAVIEAE